MSNDTFISIVAEQGSSESKWSGLFKYNDIEGYSGSILSTTHRPEVGMDIFSTPKELDREVVYCVVDGGSFGTIIWPKITSARLVNLVGHIRGLQIETLIRGLHIADTERDVKKLMIQSPILGLLFNLKPFNESVQFSPTPKFTVESVATKDFEFTSSVGKVLVGVNGFYTPSRNGLAPSFKTTCRLEIQTNLGITPVEAIRVVRKLEHLLSLLTFDFIKVEDVYFTISAADSRGDFSERSYQVERAKVTRRAKTNVEQHEVVFHLTDVDFPLLLDRFLKIFDSIEQTLHWYRIVTAEDRYLEDRFFYSIRMIEALYKALELEVSTDKSAAEAVAAIINVLATSGGNEAYIEFLENRAMPLFSRPSSADIFIDIQTKYADFPLVGILDHKIINRLRGKEVHGSTRPFSTREYEFMGFSCDAR
jgi:hypothetical protein